MKSNRALAASIAAFWIGLGAFEAGVPAQTRAAPEATTDTDPAGAPATISVILSPREVQVGDLVLAVVTVEQDRRIGKPTFPNWQRHWGRAEIRQIGEVARVDPRSDASARDRALYSQELELTAFRPGIVELPPQTVTLPGDEPVELLTEPTSFEVVSVLPAEEGEIEPKPPAPPKPLPLGSRFWWTTGLLSVLTAVLLASLLLRRRTDATFAGHPLDPWDALEAALARLAAAADAETAFTGLSLELRRYLGRTLAFPAAESTTTELRRRLLRSGLPQSICGDVVRLLVEADTVKFARKTPTPGRVLECLDQTRLAAAEVRRFLAPEAKGESDEEAA